MTPGINRIFLQPCPGKTFILAPGTILAIMFSMLLIAFFLETFFGSHITYLLFTV
jgi:hypothetical protein